jgi:hypothetical protein
MVHVISSFHLLLYCCLWFIWEFGNRTRIFKITKTYRGFQLWLDYFCSGEIWMDVRERKDYCSHWKFLYFSFKWIWETSCVRNRDSVEHTYTFFSRIERHHDTRPKTLRLLVFDDTADETTSLITISFLPWKGTLYLSFISAKNALILLDTWGSVAIMKEYFVHLS